MSKELGGRDLSRRDFLKRAAGTAVAVGAVSGLGLGLDPALAATEKKQGGMKYRTLGRTKLKVSELGMGTIVTNNAGVIQRAMDLGVTYFDTAECYQHGNAEIHLGKALKGRRDKVVVATKWHTDGNTPAEALLESLDGSLKRLGMDHVDLIQIHGAEAAAQVNSDELWEAFTAARKAGKVRFSGLSIHSNQVEVIRMAIASKRYDAVLPAYNAMNGDRLAPAVAEAHQAGLGVIAMKVLAPAHEGKGSEALKSLKGNPYQQSIQWVLRDKNVSTMIVDMPNFDELEEDHAAATGAVSSAELEEFERAVRLVSVGACHLCGACTGQCRAGIRVADVMRYILYHDGYGHTARAAALYRELPVSAAACGNCTTCAVVCPWGVAVKEKLARAHCVMA